MDEVYYSFVKIDNLVRFSSSFPSWIMRTQCMVMEVLYVPPLEREYKMCFCEKRKGNLKSYFITHLLTNGTMMHRKIDC